MLAMPELGRWIQGYLLNWLATQASLLGHPQAPVKNPVPPNKVGVTWGMTSGVIFSPPHADTPAYIHASIGTYNIFSDEDSHT